MNKSLLGGLTLACLFGAFPSVSEAQFIGNPEAINCTITRPRPVVSTHMQTRQVTTYRDVAETQYCQKQVVENVPVTTCKNVTVDEGSYQMVWVPKQVTKQVAQTTYQQQVKTVSVPVQTVRRVPQISTQMVPVQTVQYVNETVPIQMTAFAGSCDTCATGGSYMSQSFSSQSYVSPVVPVPSYQPAPYSSSAIPTMPAITIPPSQSNQIPIPGAQAIYPSRTSMNTHEETVPARGVPTPRDDAAPSPRKTSMFQGVPSAASAWQRQSALAR